MWHHLTEEQWGRIRTEKIHVYIAGDGKIVAADTNGNLGNGYTVAQALHDLEQQ